MNLALTVTILYLIVVLVTGFIASRRKGGAIWTFAGSPYGVEPIWIALAIGCFTLFVVSLIKKPSHLKGADGLNLEY